MPNARVDASLGKPQVEVLVDIGHPILNRVFDGFVKVAGVGAVHAATQESVKCLLQDEMNKKSFENMILKCEFSETELCIGSGRRWAKRLANRVGKEAFQWGLVAGLYSGMTYGLEEARGVHDWKNALFGGALTGVALSLTESNPTGDRAIKGAITGGAIATAAEILKNIT
ncbi:unnamed protein product [Calypogeia fissa]